MSTRHRRFVAAAALATATALAMAGCGADSSPEATPDQTTSAGTSSAALAQNLTPDETDAADPSAGPSDPEPKSETPEAPESERPALVVSEIRMGDYQGKDRVVFELDGTGVPSYTVDYADAPVQQGSGFPVEVDGDSFLQVMIGGQVLPTETDMTEIPVGLVTGDGASGVNGVYFAGQFEGLAQSVIGLDGTDRDFSAFTLQNPTRLVIDIAR